MHEEDGAPLGEEALDLAGGQIAQPADDVCEGHAGVLLLRAEGGQELGAREGAPGDQVLAERHLHEALVDDLDGGRIVVGELVTDVVAVAADHGEPPAPVPLASISPGRRQGNKNGTTGGGSRPQSASYVAIGMDCV